MQSASGIKLQNFDETVLLSRVNAVRLFIVLILSLGYASTMPLGPGYKEVFNVYGYDPSWIGIQLLFFISGILALRSISQGRMGLAYLSSRFWRNIPTLAALTVVTLFVLFPLFGTPPDEGLALWGRLGKYVALTVFCIDPGIPLEGLLDDARYMCLVQGGIWTLRYGVILHILTAITGRIGILSIKPLILFGTVITTLAYFGLTYVAVKNDLTAYAAPLAGLRLSYAFLAGMAVWAYREKLSGLKQGFWIIPATIFALTTLKYFHGPWSPLIEVGLTYFWASLTWFMLSNPNRIWTFMKAWPNLVLPIMLINWPMSQVILLLNPEIGLWEIIITSLLGTIALSLLFNFGFSKTTRFATKLFQNRGYKTAS